MDNKDRDTPFQKTLHFFLTKIIIGIVVIVGVVALAEWLRKVSLDKTNLSDSTKNIVIALVDSFLAVSVYILLFRAYEKRKVNELSAAIFLKNAFFGFAIGLILQSLFIFIIYLAGTYSIIHVNSVSTLITPFAFAMTAGFVAEILILGVVFRLLEEQSGTLIALAVFIILFAVLHVNTKGATFVSVAATAMQAGFLLPAAYVFGRNLWLPIFLHFSWDFAEPGIFGAINPSTSEAQGLLASHISGSPLITGGQMGPQDSIQSLILCSLTGILFLLLAKRKKNFIKSKWLTS
ncbi:MAG TPA: CPBP family intramembrane glutamic endopeptidase [Chitinophagaceae bacterium]|nr:CPBP family intramembrane glutamic endopeptidase [Chitinophagaceae bacterium]